jgi:hypothetical protein
LIVLRTELGKLSPADPNRRRICAVSRDSGKPVKGRKS